MNYPNISYCITCCNEVDSLQKLLCKINQCLTGKDEIIIVIDKDNFIKETENVALAYKDLNKEFFNVKVFYHSLNKNYAAFKNKCIEESSGDYIFHIDADEFPPDRLIYYNLKYLLESNPNIELYRVPRINNFIGVTQEDATRYGWDINNPHKWINWNIGDYQSRIFKRDYPRIKWIGKLHERIDGFKEYAILPKEEEYALLHTKTIERQRSTNERYNTTFTVDENLGRSTEC